MSKELLIGCGAGGDASPASAAGMTVTGWARGLLNGWPEGAGCVILEVSDKRAMQELVRLAELGQQHRPSTKELVWRHLGLNASQRCDLIEIVRDLLGQTDEGSSAWLAAAGTFNALLDSGHREVLAQLVETGPVWDGNIVSKVHRDELISWGLAGRACVGGKQGYTAANYAGWGVHHAIRALRGLPRQETAGGLLCADGASAEVSKARPGAC